MQNAGQITAADTTHVVGQFILCKTHGIKVFMPLDIKSIVNAAMTEGAMTANIGAKMMIDGNIMTDMMAVRMMGRGMEIIKVMGQISIKAKVITKAKTTKVETAEAMTVTKSI